MSTLAGGGPAAGAAEEFGGNFFGNGAHLSGLAADFRVPGLTARDVCLAIKDHASIGYEKLICEGGWTHIAFTDQARAPAMETLTAHFGKGPVTYTKGIM